MKINLSKNKQTQVMIKLRLTLLFSLMVIAFSSFGQTKIEKADRLYENLEFVKAIPLYLDALESSDDISIKEKLANCYRLINDVSNAEDWLQEVVKSGASDDIYKLFYGQALMENEKYAEAEYWLSQFSAANPSHAQARNLLYASQNIRALKGSGSGCTVSALPDNVNSEYSEIGPAFYQDGIVFSSDRDTTVLKYVHSWTGRSFYDLYNATDNGDGSYSNAKRNKYGSVGTARFHEGPVSFSRDETTMFYTRNNFVKGQGGLTGKVGRDSGGTIRLKIYEAELQNGKWVTVDSLSINSDEYSTAHPALSDDGMKLYFASDMPGGYGGMDLYVMERTGSGWGTAVNLGPDINTEGDEVFPFYHPSGDLYFSSDGLVGCGGLDIFKVATMGTGIAGKARNVGSPLNTARDDFGYILNDDGTKGYLASNRNESRVGDDDIYSTYCESYYLRGVVVDCETDNAIEGASVNLSGGGSMLDGITTGSDGSFSFEVKPGMEYMLAGSAMNYISNSVDVSTEGMSAGEDMFVKVPLCPEPQCAAAGTPCDDGNPSTTNDVEDGNCNCSGRYVVIEQPPLPPATECFISGRVYNENTSSPVNGARIRIRDNSTGYEQVTFSDNSGYYSFKSTEGATYTVSTDADCYYAATKTTNYGDNCTVTIDFPLRPILVGEVSLLHIYYDLDKAFIRSDAEPELTKLYDLLRDNPTLTVELASHTDSRGSDSYNQDLSQRRADSARSWLISRGIDASRITSVGYGESQLVNQCANGVTCSDSEHQQNRRTEFRVTGGCAGSIQSNPSYYTTPSYNANPYSSSTTSNVYSFDK